MSGRVGHGDCKEFSKGDQVEKKERKDNPIKLSVNKFC